MIQISSRVRSEWAGNRARNCVRVKRRAKLRVRPALTHSLRRSWKHLLRNMTGQIRIRSHLGIDSVRALIWLSHYNACAVNDHGFQVSPADASIESFST